MAGQLALRAMHSCDLALVQQWLAEPHVARWYLTGSTAEEELDDLRRCIAGEEPTYALLVVQHGRPIGWCQWYLCSAYPDHEAGLGAERGDVGIDYAIGDLAHTGQGVGTALIAALVAWVQAQQPGAGVIADPEATNIASRRVLEKNGFCLLREGPVESEPSDAVMAIYRLAPRASATNSPAPAPAIQSRDAPKQL